MAQSTDASTINSYLQSIQMERYKQFQRLENEFQPPSKPHLQGLQTSNVSQLSKALVETTRRHQQQMVPPRGNSKLDPMINMAQMQKSLHLDDIKRTTDQYPKLPTQTTRGRKLPPNIQQPSVRTRYQ